MIIRTEMLCISRRKDMIILMPAIFCWDVARLDFSTVRIQIDDLQGTTWQLETGKSLT